MKVVCLELGRMGNNNYLVVNEDSNEAILIDCGGTADEIIREICLRGLRLTAVLLTHGHIDHIQAIDGIAAYYSCPVYIHSLDRDFLVRPEYNLSKRIFGQAFCAETVPVILEEELTVAGMNITVIHTPGHTPGSVCFRMGNTLFTGDTLFADSIGAELPPFGDSKTEIDSIRRELFTIPDDCICYPGHGKETSLFYERKNNLYCRI